MEVAVAHNLEQANHNQGSQGDQVTVPFLPDETSVAAAVDALFDTK
jgi:hypothetical protein